MLNLLEYRRELRHSNASYLIAELGADVSHRLGHNNPITTFKYHAHIFSDMILSLLQRWSSV